MCLHSEKRVRENCLAKPAACVQPPKSSPCVPSSKQVAVVQPLRHCEEHSDEAIFFSQQSIYKYSPIDEKCRFCGAKPAACAHRRILGEFVHMLSGGGAYVYHLSSFALCAKLAAVRQIKLIL